VASGKEIISVSRNYEQMMDHPRRRKNKARESLEVDQCEMVAGFYFMTQ
jgi:hypothetical protein